MPNLTLDQSRFQELVKVGLRKVTTEFSPELAKTKPMKDILYTTQGSDRAYDDYYSVGGLSDVPKFNGVLTYSDVPPGYSTRIEPAEFALGVETERKFWENNLYPVLKNMREGLLTSERRTQEKYAVKGYANIASTAFDFMTSEEGVAIASSAHTTKAVGVSTTLGFSNLGSTAFSPTAVEATRILMGGFKNFNGDYMSVRGNGWIGPTTLEQKFEEVSATQKGLYSAEGTVNVQNTRTWKYETSQFFNDYSTKSWGMVNWEMLKKYALWIDRVSAETNGTVDFETFKIKDSVYSYWGYGFTGWPFIHWMTVS